jgi:hypothetical protein
MERYPSNNIAGWWNHKLVQPFVTEQAQFSPPWRSGMFQFYRISGRFIAALDDWQRTKNNGEWVFFEPLFANFAFRNYTNLTTHNFIDNSIGYKVHIKFRPCFSLEQVYNSSQRGGLFHPVKKGDPLAEGCLRWVAPNCAETNKKARLKGKQKQDS